VEPCVPWLADTLEMVGHPMVTNNVITMGLRPAAVAGTVGAVAGPVDAHDVVTVVTCPALATCFAMGSCPAMYTGTVCTMRFAVMLALNMVTMRTSPTVVALTMSIAFADTTSVASFNPVTVSVAFSKRISLSITIAQQIIV